MKAVTELFSNRTDFAVANQYMVMLCTFIS